MNPDSWALSMLAESDSALLQTLQLRVLRTTAQCTAPPSVPRNVGAASSPAPLSFLPHGLAASSRNRTDVRQHGSAAHNAACWAHLPPTRHISEAHIGNNPTGEGAVAKAHDPDLCRTPPQPSTKTSTLNPQPSIPQPPTPNPQPSTLNPQPSTLNPAQLYGFHKTTQDPDLCEFQHKHFKRDNPGLLHNIKRKVPLPTLET